MAWVPWTYLFTSLTLLSLLAGASICLLAWRAGYSDTPLPAPSRLIGTSRNVWELRGDPEIEASKPSKISDLIGPLKTPNFPDFDDVCSSMAPVNYTSAPTRDDRILLRFISAIHTVIPPSTLFAPMLRSPCWFMHLSNIYLLQKDLEDLSEFTDTEASLLLGKALLTKARYLVCLPRIFFIGFPRSGTTQIYNMLTKHPDIFSGRVKEPHWWTKGYFEERFPRNVLAVLKYITQFSAAAQEVIHNPNAMIMDASQSTIWDTRMVNNLCIMPWLISSVVPDARYLVAMREPASRLFSDFKYLAYRLQWLSKTDDVAQLFHKEVVEEVSAFTGCLQNRSLEMCVHLSTVSKRVRLGVSIYYVHVAKWLRAIPKDQFIFVRTEDLSESPKSLIDELWNFLELKPQTLESLGETLNEHANPSMLEEEMQPSTRQLLLEFFRPFNDKLSRLLKDERFLWEDLQ